MEQRPALGTVVVFVIVFLLGMPLWFLAYALGMICEGWALSFGRGRRDYRLLLKPPPAK